MATLQNEKCIISYDEEKKEIFGRDLTDRYNDPAFYNKTVRGIKKAWLTLENSFTDSYTMFDSMRVLDDNNIRTHSYCMMD